MSDPMFGACHGGHRPPFMSPDRNRTELSLPTSARVAAGLAGVLWLGMLAVLIAVLVSLEGTRSELRTTRAGVTDADQRLHRVTERVRPLLDAVAPLTEKSSQRDLRRSGRTLTDAAGRPSPRRGRPQRRLFAELNRGGGQSLASCDEKLRTQAPSATGQIGCLLRVVPNVRGLLRSQRQLNRASLTTQRHTLSRTRRVNELFVQSLDIQRELLKETRSIDRKLPPPVTPPGP